MDWISERAVQSSTARVHRKWKASSESRRGFTKKEYMFIVRVI